MFALSNSELTVLILDPVADVARLGSRYCTGGYIWQVADARLGNLFTGPEYPKEPNTFDGQGAPDMFQTPLGAEGAAVGQDVACIGVGRVRRISLREPFDVRHNPDVTEFVKWEIHCTRDTIAMRTEHAFHDWAYQLERVVTLRDRTVHSATAIRSVGVAPLPVRWFAHPFFPIPADNVLCRFSFPIYLTENPGYFLDTDGFVTRKPTHDWLRGCRQEPTFDAADQPMLAVQKHPLLGEVTVATDFAPSFMPLWGNDRTFSFEPYFEQALERDATRCWSINYRLNPPETSPYFRENHRR